MTRTHGVTHYDPDSCFGCKLVSVQFGRSTFHPHFNYSVGQYVTSPRDFNEKLHVASDQATDRSGIVHDFQPLHPSELISMVPDETAPSHLEPLSDGRDPTIPDRHDSRQRQRQQERVDAIQRSETENLIDA